VAAPHSPRVNVVSRPSHIIPAPPAWDCPLQYSLNMERAPVRLNVQSPRRDASTPRPFISTAPGLYMAGSSNVDAWSNRGVSAPVVVFY
jgi:hypothetical protein